MGPCREKNITHQSPGLARAAPAVMERCGRFRGRSVPGPTEGRRRRPCALSAALKSKGIVSQFASATCRCHLTPTILKLSPSAWRGPLGPPPNPQPWRRRGSLLSPGASFIALMTQTACSVQFEARDWSVMCGTGVIFPKGY